MSDITIKFTQQEIWFLDIMLGDAGREHAGLYAKFQQHREEYQPNAEASFLRNIKQIDTLKEKINVFTK
jgi:hypothetical protein|tara:strand:+ start:381 stop:587 length:207 start_codon:yes stop_codon:yes gene_type:complete